MLIAGIDPGLSGAVALLDLPTMALRVVDVPVFTVERGGKLKREIDAAGLVQILGAVRIGHAFVEQVGAMPGQGVTSMFSLGRTFGTILGALAALGVPVTRVAPVTWKRALQVPAAKDAARARASELLPAFAFHWPLTKHDGRAEAALIAEYGRRALATIASGQAA